MANQTFFESILKKEGLERVILSSKKVTKMIQFVKLIRKLDQALGNLEKKKSYQGIFPECPSIGKWKYDK